MVVEGRRMNLSKSKFIAGVQCLKRLYFQVHRPELAGGPDEVAMAVMSQGQEVGLLAREMFPGGSAVENSHSDPARALERTAELLAEQHVPAVFEAAFRYDGILVRVDILQRLPGGQWRLIEVKSSTNVKQHYLYDVAIQQHVLQGCGLEVQPRLMHLNRDYVYDGDGYELERLFTIRDLTAEVDKLDPDLPKLLGEQWRTLAQGSPPDIKPGAQCTNPITCEFYDCCNAPLPGDHVSCLPGIRAPRVAELIDLGISSIHDIPPGYPLSARQRRACDSVQAGEPVFAEGLKDELNLLTYPLYFMDFETVYPALPRYHGMRPYDHIPFQWSVHVRREPAAELEHFEFLAENDRDPRPAFLESLYKILGQYGHIVVYNQSFESERLTELARWLPEFDGPVRNIQSRLWDLLAVLRAYVYHPQFMGSFSLKSVLPPLVPGMTYEDMEVAEGGQAG